MKRTRNDLISDRGRNFPFVVTTEFEPLMFFKLEWSKSGSAKNYN